jgi:serine/threonine protein kinase
LSVPISYLKPGQKLGKYEIKGRLGRGGMAEAYRALNPDLDQEVAIKVLHPQLLEAVSGIGCFRTGRLVNWPEWRRGAIGIYRGMPRSVPLLLALARSV